MNPQTMNIRRAIPEDLPGIDKLLSQVNAVHHEGRPDLFNLGRKYTDSELLDILADDTRPIFVAVDNNGAEGEIMGYAFCVYQQIIGDNIRTDIRTLYIDDLCVDEDLRGSGVGTALYNYVINFAREQGLYNVTLNVWSCNPSAQAFYEARGLTPYRIGMEQIL